MNLIGFKQCGFIELATNSDRLEEYRRVSAFNRKCGVNVKEISAAEVKSLFPLCNTDDVLAGFYVAEDGRVNPVVRFSLYKGNNSDLIIMHNPLCHSSTRMLRWH